MSFSCQQCGQPLVLHEGLDQARDGGFEATHELLSRSFPTSREPEDLGDAVLVERMGQLQVSPDRRDALLLHVRRDSERRGDGSSHSPALLNDKRAELFEALSSAPGNGDDVVDHPLCRPCTLSLLDAMSRSLSDVRKEHDTLLDLEKQLAQLDEYMNPNSASEESVARWKRMQNGLAHELRELEEENARLEEELRGADKEQAKLDGELRALQAQESEFGAEEEAFWKECNVRTRELDEIRAENTSNEAKIRNDEAVLERLRKTNVYSDVFAIGHDSHGCATINGLRLGRISTVEVDPTNHRRRVEQVEWPEINAAWGQTALLITVLARKLGVTFNSYQVVPRGSSSVVQSAGSDKTTYELYGTSDWQIGRLLHSRRFDQAMVGILACVQQLVDHASQRDSSLRLPYVINKDRIGDASIRLQFNQPDAWTRANRYLLVTLRALLTWTLEHASEP